jgi:hypothetical protein
MEHAENYLVSLSWPFFLPDIIVTIYINTSSDYKVVTNISYAVVLCLVLTISQDHFMFPDPAETGEAAQTLNHLIL